MSDAPWALGAATLLSALGMWLMLPRGAAGGRALGWLLALLGLGFFASQMPPLGAWSSDIVFWALAAVTVIASAATVTLRSPVYCAIWFALSLLGTAGLFLYQGAQFLGVATVVVYAGAILVTFLFVLMLASPGGDAFYDRLSWESFFSAVAGVVLVGMLSLVLGELFGADAKTPPQALFTDQQLKSEILADEHMAHLGAQLFSTYLVAVEVAGTLLLVALVGAVAIVAQRQTPKAVEDRLPTPGPPDNQLTDGKRTYVAAGGRAGDAR